MAFDFPASPTLGQQFTPAGGPTYTYNGYGWTFGSSGVADSSRVLLATYNPAGTNAVVINSSILTSAYDTYEIVNCAFNNSGSNSVLCCQFSIDGGATFINAAGAYVYTGTYSASGSSAPASVGGSATYFQLDVGQDLRSDLPARSTMRFFKNVSGVFPMAKIATTSWGAGNLYDLQQSVLCQGTASVVNGIKLYWASGGNFGANSVIKVYGIK
jgi:hypothetical protein